MLSFRLWLGLLCVCTSVWAGIKSVQMDVDRAFPAQQILEQLELPAKFDTLPDFKQKALLFSAKSNVEELGRLNGYYKCSVQVLTQKKPFVLWARFGPRFSLRSVDLVPVFMIDQTWDTLGLEMGELSRIAKPYLGEPIGQEQLIELSQKVAEHVRNKGFLDLVLDEEIAVDSLRPWATYRLRLEMGPRARMGFLRFNINQPKTKEKGLTRQLYLWKLWPHAYGQVLQEESFAQFRKKLMGTGVFSSVRLRDTVTADGGGARDVWVDAVEKVPGAISGRAFFSYDNVIDGGVSAGVSHKNVGGALHQVQLEAVAAWRQQRISAGYSHPLPWGWSLRLDEKILYQRLLDWDPAGRFDVQRSYVTNRIGLSQSLGSHFQWRLNSDFGLRQFDFPDSNVLNENDLRELQFRLDPIWTLDFTDVPTDPKFGFRSALGLGLGGAWDWDRRFVTYRLENRIYLPVGVGVSLAGGIEYGGFWKGEDEDEAKAFYQGGYRTLRGYAPQSLFPLPRVTVSSVWDPIAQKFVDEERKETSKSPVFSRLSAEVRWDNAWMESLQHVFFLDQASIQDAKKSYLKRQEGLSMGLGMRYTLSALTFRLDYAWWKGRTRTGWFEPFETNRISFDLSQAI